MGAHPGQARPGEWLRQQRVTSGLTQEDLAERSGVSVRAIADLERGRTRKPYPSSVRALVRALGLPEAAGDSLVARYRSSATQQGATGAGTGPGTARQVRADDGQGGPAVPRQLPTRVPHFAGRAAELALLDSLLDAASGESADPGDVLHGFLDALGVPPERLPGDTEGLAVVLRQLGEHDEAVTCFLRAVTLDREMGNRYDLAMVLAHLGQTYLSVGDLRGAREAWDESLLILRTLHTWPRPGSTA